MYCLDKLGRRSKEVRWIMFTSLFVNLSDMEVKSLGYLIILFVCAIKWCQVL